MRKLMEKKEGKKRKARKAKRSPTSPGPGCPGGSRLRKTPVVLLRPGIERSIPPGAIARA